MKIKDKIKKYLGVKDLEVKLLQKNVETTYVKDEMYRMNESTRRALGDRIQHLQDSVNAIQKTVESVVHIGTDVDRDPLGHSWAVICVEGKMNIVKFVDLNGQNARDILMFLKQFEAGRHCIDSPYREIFNKGLFRF